MGELGIWGARAVFWRTNIRQMKKQGFRVQEWDIGWLFGGNAIGNTAKELSADLQKVVGQLSRGRALYGWYSWSHYGGGGANISAFGGPYYKCGIECHPKKHSELKVSVDDLSAQLEYKLGRMVVHGCGTEDPYLAQHMLADNPQARFLGHPKDFWPSWAEDPNAKPFPKIAGWEPFNPSSWGGNWRAITEQWKAAPAGMRRASVQKGVWTWTK
jgi:hypothetical protein